MTKAAYLHIPFCAHHCSYCDFTRCGYHQGLADQYITSLEQQIQRLPQELKTFYIGGGTPTALNEEQLKYLFDLLTNYLKDCQEVTIEVNPETMTPLKYQILKESKVNRVSIGAQSTHPHILIQMNRQHQFEDVITCIQDFKAIGIDNYSLDLIYAWPNQTLAELALDLERLIDLEPPHLSVYSLTIEANSYLGRQQIKPISDSLETEMFELIVDKLKEAGYLHYEVANFCKPGFPSLHNQVYWHYDDFIGIGLGASGKEGNQRYTNTTKFVQYLNNPFLKEDVIQLTESDRYFEFLMMNLRLEEGVSFERFKNKFNKNFLDIFPLTNAKLQSYLKAGLLVLDDTSLKATSQGRMMLNDILIEFMD